MFDHTLNRRFSALVGISTLFAWFQVFLTVVAWLPVMWPLPAEQDHDRHLVLNFYRYSADAGFDCRRMRTFYREIAHIRLWQRGFSRVPWPFQHLKVVVAWNWDFIRSFSELLLNPIFSTNLSTLNIVLIQHFYDNIFTATKDRCICLCKINIEEELFRSLP